MRKIFLTVLMTMLFLVSNSTPSFAYEQEIRILSASMADNISKAGKKRIAVVDFTDLQGNVTELGRFIAEELSVDLINTAKGFEVIDRNHLNRILAEHKLSVSGIVDQKTVQKLGQIAGVDALITGSITPLERSIRVVCKVIATDTASVISAAKGDIEKTKAIEELFGKGIEAGTQPAQAANTNIRQKAKAEAKQRVEAKYFLFELQGCEASRSGVICNLLITNKGDDRTLGFCGSSSWCTPHSRMFDDRGNEYRAEIVQLGNKKGSNISNVLISNVPTNASLSFEKVSTGATKITLLELGVWDEKEVDFKVQFRNIPLSK